jgi:hypothetical protein
MSGGAEAAAVDGDHYVRGSIVRVRMRNFVTYDDAESS